jgi:dTDP-4-dehydrorhamnose 3,5-epimerase
MVFEPLALARAYLVHPTRVEDDHGVSGRTWRAEDFAAHGLDPVVAECGVVFNKACATLRGLHYQAPPYTDAKLVRCTRGAVFDVIVDLRPASATYLRHCAVVLTEENRAAIYVPPGCAHGFLTLEDDTEVLYQMSVAEVTSAARGVRWDDPAFGIAWPAPPDVIAARDRAWPLL